MQSWILSGLAAIFIINALCLLFMGNFTERGSAHGKYKTHEFEKNKIGFSCTVGLLLVLGIACLHFGQPHLYLVAVKKVPQLHIVNDILKMQNGIYYLIGGGFAVTSLVAFFIRNTISGASTFTKGSMDLDPATVKRHEAKMRAETPDWHRDAERKASSQFDDGTPL